MMQLSDFDAARAGVCNMRMPTGYLCSAPMYRVGDIMAKLCVALGYDIFRNEQGVMRKMVLSELEDNAFITRNTLQLLCSGLDSVGLKGNINNLDVTLNARVAAPVWLPVDGETAAWLYSIGVCTEFPESATGRWETGRGGYKAYRVHTYDLLRVLGNSSLTIKYHEAEDFDTSELRELRSRSDGSIGLFSRVKPAVKEVKITDKGSGAVLFAGAARVQSETEPHEPGGTTIIMSNEDWAKMQKAMSAPMDFSPEGPVMAIRDAIEAECRRQMKESIIERTVKLIRENPGKIFRLSAIGKHVRRNKYYQTFEGRTRMLYARNDTVYPTNWLDITESNVRDSVRVFIDSSSTDEQLTIDLVSNICAEYNFGGTVVDLLDDDTGELLFFGVSLVPDNAISRLFGLDSINLRYLNSEGWN